MSKIDSRIPADWFTRAEKDFVAARHLLDEPENAFIAPAAMLLQQAVEKYLKGLALFQRQELKRTHDLAELLDDVSASAPELAEFDDACIKITEYFTEQRYPPLVDSGLTREEVLESLSSAADLISLIRQRIPGSDKS